MNLNNSIQIVGLFCLNAKRKEAAALAVRLNQQPEHHVGYCGGNPIEMSNNINYKKTIKKPLVQLGALIQ
jgi:hypothetical protein